MERKVQPQTCSFQDSDRQEGIKYMCAQSEEGKYLHPRSTRDTHRHTRGRGTRSNSVSTVLARQRAARAWKQE